MFFRLMLACAFVSMPTAAYSQALDGSNDFIFRYKAEIAGNPADENVDEPPSVEDEGPSGGEEGPSENGICEPGESGLPDCDGVCDNFEIGSPDCSLQEDNRIEDVSIIPDDFVGGDSDVLTLIPTSAKSAVEPDGIIYQCFQAEGGFGNYHFILDPYVNGEHRSWVESFDIVLDDDLGTTLPSSVYEDSWGEYLVAPAYDAVNDRFPVDYEGEVCVRVKVKEDAFPVSDAMISSFYVMDYSESSVTAGSISPYDFFMGDNWINMIVHLKPECTSDCNVGVPTPPDDIWSDTDELTLASYPSLTRLTPISSSFEADRAQWLAMGGAWDSINPPIFVVANAEYPLTITIEGNPEYGPEGDLWYVGPPPPSLGDGLCSIWTSPTFQINDYAPGDVDMSFSGTVTVQDANGDSRSIDYLYKISNTFMWSHGEPASGSLTITIPDCDGTQLIVPSSESDPD